MRFWILIILIFGEIVVAVPTSRIIKPAAAKYFYGGLSLVSWQDSMTVTSPTNDVSSLLSTTVGVCLGGGASFLISRSLFLDVGACGFIAESSAGLVGAVPSQLLYSARGVRSYGIQGGPGLLWALGSRRLQLGVSIPLLLKQSSWPQPGAGYTLQADARFSYGLLLDARFIRDRMLLNPKVGFLGSLSQFYWNIGIGYVL